jgi:hypothetical protein
VCHKLVGRACKRVILSVFVVDKEVALIVLGAAVLGIAATWLILSYRLLSPA